MGFDDTIDLFDRYYRAADQAQLAGFNRDLGCEVRERLEQLRWLEDEIRSLHRQAQAIFQRVADAMDAHAERLNREGLSHEEQPAPAEVKMTPEEIEQDRSVGLRLKLFTESFYYIAFRVQSILRHKEEPLPGLRSFKCPGVRDVRNHLLEHPDGRDSRVFLQSLSCGGPNGPALKTVRPRGQENVHRDAGLFPNAEEFRRNLERLLRASTPPPTGPAVASPKPTES